MSARRWVSRMFSRAISERWYALSVTTIATTRVTTPATCFAFIDMLAATASVARSHLLLHAVQLVVQRLEADAEHLGRACLVVAAVFERQQDQAAFGLVHRGAGG